MITIKIAVIICVLFNLFPVSTYAYDTSDTELLYLIKACADIGDYDRNSKDVNELMLRVLYTYRNFEIITDKNAYLTQTDKIKMCRTDFIKDVVYKAFRIDAPTPSPEKLTELGYCENNGFYYFTGGYTEYFATDVIDIQKVVVLPDGSQYVIFTNYYQEGENEPVLEYSSMQFARDNEGYFVISIDMDDDFMKLNSLIQPQVTNHSFDDFKKYLPWVIIITSLCISAFVFYRFFL